MLFLTLSIALGTFAATPRDQVHGGVTFTFQTDAAVDPDGILDVAIPFLEARNRQDVSTALKYVHERQRDRWKAHLSKTVEKRELSVETILVFKGDYRNDGKRERDQLMARVHTRSADGKGNISFLMLMTGGRWDLVAD
jgi:hypothetical protein